MSPSSNPLIFVGASNDNSGVEEDDYYNDNEDDCDEDSDDYYDNGDDGKKLRW